jgi:hypothetical protein
MLNIEREVGGNERSNVEAEEGGESRVISRREKIRKRVAEWIGGSGRGQ